MTKRALLTAALISALLLSAVAGALSNLLAKANPNLLIQPSNPTIIIKSPTNQTYNTSTLSLEVTFKTYKTVYWGPEEEALRLFTYTLDEKKPELITITNSSVGRAPGDYVFFEGSANLTKLTKGPHNVTVRVLFNYSDSNDPHNPSGVEHYKFHTESITTVHFTIETTTNPSFTTVSVITVSGASTFIIAVGLLLYFKKRKH